MQNRKNKHMCIHIKTTNIYTQMYLNNKYVFARRATIVKRLGYHTRAHVPPPKPTCLRIPAQSTHHRILQQCCKGF